MPDIQMRFHRDMLVISEPLNGVLSKAGYDVESGLEMLDLLEEEAVEQALRTQMAAGPQCLCTPTFGITRARLAHARMRDRQRDAAQAAIGLCRPFRPQHLIAEVGSTRLPLDAMSKASLVANRDQYAEAVVAFGPENVDAFLFNGLAGAEDVRCALMGARKECATPVIVSVDVDDQGTLLGRSQTIEDVLAVADDLQADAVGIRTKAAPSDAAAIARRMARASGLPILVQLDVGEPAPRRVAPAEGNPYWHPDTMVAAAELLRAAGVQFLRAAGSATPSYTGALSAATAGLPTVR
ncbi:homocysteine S-methyltransferase family protein [Curtanaerobium respiraculi]|uniref:homocysteine S-methyltransferase family protein n=1 Tax=Curtanaerobium respiraculi TaxID=2949669 RepID=UPI0024B34F12|nr:homocysteine S-methyltransferase family protein [Curtanaerobium respiraculi]